MNDTPKKRGPKPKMQVPPIAAIDDHSTDGPNEPVPYDAPPAAIERPRGGIPPCPESDPTLGMKTPAVVAWWHEFHPAEAAVKYAGLTLPEIEA